MEALEAGVEVRVHLHPVGVEFQLRGIEQRLVGGEARDHVVHGLDEVDDVHHGPVGHGGGDVPRHHVRQGGPDVGLGQLLLPRPLPVQDVPEALDQNLARPQHVGQLPHLLGVGDGLVEGDAEIVGAEDGQVCVVTFIILIRMSVDHRQIVVIVLLADEAAGVLAEGPDLVLEGLGPAHQLGLVEHPVHHLHDLVPDLHPDADVHSARGVGDVVLRAELLQPVRPPAARGDDGVPGVNLEVLAPVGDRDALADVVLQDQVLALVAEENFHAVLLEIALDPQVDVVGLLRAHVADGAVHQLQSRLDGPLADLLPVLRVLQTLDVGVRAEVQVDLVRIVDGLLGQIRADEGGQVPAHLVAQGQLPVGEGPRAGEAGGDVAVGLAAHTLVGLALGAAAVFNALPLLHHDDLLPAPPFQQLQGGENTGGAGSHDDDVCVHSGFSFL